MLGKQDSLYDSLYRRVAMRFGISSCEVLILYFLLLEEENATQSKICSQIMYPKQTVNSAVAKLVKNGMVVLTEVEGTGKSKRLTLTPKGEEFANQTVNRLFQAEIRASKQMGIEKLKLLCDLRNEYYELLKKEFEADFLGDANNNVNESK